MGLRHVGGLLAAASGFVSLTAIVFAQEAYVKPVIADGAIVDPLTAVAGNPEEGKKTISNRGIGNCLACHTSKAFGKEAFHGDIAPPLDGAGSRYSAAQLRAIVVNSKEALNPDSAMPGFYIADPAPRVIEKFKGKTIMTAQQVEDVVAFLETLKE